MRKIKMCIISLFIGLSLLGTNIVSQAAAGHSTTGSFLGLFGALMLILMAIWDFADHYAEIHTKARMNDEQSK
jgi:hypothetical protein